MKTLLTALSVAALTSLAACGGGGGNSPGAAVSTDSSSIGAALNALRAQNGRDSLARDARLDTAARTHANDMAARGYFSHTSPNGDELDDRLRIAGYDYCFGAENIAQGQPDEAAVLASWMQSSGHRANLLSPDAEAYGFASAQDYWVMVFGSGC